MNELNHISEELKPVAPLLASLERRLPYRVPEGYFELLSGSVVEQVLLQDSLSMIKAGDVPPGYFDQLPALILQKAKEQDSTLELQEFAPVLAGLSKSMPYQLPEGYFENLNPLAAAHQKPVRSILPISTKAWLRVAAALLVLLAVFALWRMTDQSGQSKSTPAEMVLAPADSAAIHESLATLDEETLSTYFAEWGVEEETKSMTFYFDTTNIEQALASFSEEELKSQLMEIPLTQKGI